MGEVELPGGSYDKRWFMVQGQGMFCRHERMIRGKTLQIERKV